MKDSVALNLTNKSKSMQRKALCALKPLGVTLTEAASFYAEYHELKDPK